ncbi:uncharacterized protein LOC119912408 [Micropterus salmoides]|uniref:uncharacterized protein LOC119912408 n=1 Tax=Micropterus salmoides TaxID=27706 RepID=UPI0018ED6877|nr:uncharacterized protein LOC119912408 [Micropterus salmoides]
MIFPDLNQVDLKGDPKGPEPAHEGAGLVHDVGLAVLQGGRGAEVGLQGAVGGTVVHREAREQQRKRRRRKRKRRVGAVSTVTVETAVPRQVHAEVAMANKAELHASDHTPSAEEELPKPAARRPRRRAAAPLSRRGQRGKRRGPAEKRRGPGEKRRGPKEKRRGQEEKKKEGVTVKRTCSDGKRRWDKKHYCVFCRRPQVKIARHLLRKHADQQEVVAASTLPTGSKQRHLLLEHLRCRGNYLHNIEVIRQGTGEIVPWRQPSEEVDPRNYLPCPLCLGFFLRADLWKHQAFCRKKLTSDPSKDPASKAETTSDPVKDATSDSTGKAASDPADDRTSKSTEDTPSDPLEDTSTADQTGTKRPLTSDPGVDQNVSANPGADRPKKRIRVQAAASRLLPISSGASESCSEVLHRMNQDHVSHQVKSDWLICKYGNKLMGNQDGSQRRYDYVSQKLRELGRLLLAAKSLDSSIQTLQDLLAPGCLSLALAAARKASGYRWSRPPLVVKTTLKTVCEIAIGESLQDGDWEAAAKTTEFYHLLGRDWDNLGLLNPDPDTAAPVGGAKPKKRLVQSRNEKECKEPGEEQSDPRPEVPSQSSNRPVTSIIPPEARLQTPITVPVAPRKVQRRPWSSAEKEAVWRQLGVHVLVQSVPGKEVCQRCLDLEPVLRGRHWKDVKNQVHNQIQSQKKQQFHAQMDLQENQDQQDQIQNQKKQQHYQAEMHQQDKDSSQNKKKQQYLPQMDPQETIQNHKKQQYLPQMDPQETIQNHKKQQYLPQMDPQETIQNHKKQQYLPQMDPQDTIQNHKKQQYLPQMDPQETIQNHKKQQYLPQMDPQETIQNHKKQQYLPQMDPQETIQNHKKQQYLPQMDPQDTIQNHKKLQYHTQMDHQDHLQIHKKQLCHGRLDPQDHIQIHKKQLYQMDAQTQALQTTLDRDTSILTGTPYGPDGPHRVPGQSLLERDPTISPYPLPHRTLGPHMDQLLSRTEWTDESLAQHYSLSRHLDRNLLPDAPTGGPPPNPHSGHVHF